MSRGAFQWTYDPLFDLLIPTWVWADLVNVPQITAPDNADLAEIAVGDAEARAEQYSTVNQPPE